MERITYTTIDKSSWPRGPWDSEPDKVQWQDETTHLPCLIVRSPSGALCGYVGVPRSHPFYERYYDDCNIDAHGGLTFAGHCSKATPEAWARLRAHRNRLEAEAKAYPHGDAAETLQKYSASFDDFSAYVEVCERTAICHRPAEGEAGDIWWLGFDCAHLGDIMPKRDRQYCSGTYKDIAYVTRECKLLAKQLAAAA